MAFQGLMNTYKRLPVSFDRGEGPWLFDKDNNKYLDALSGLGVCGLGHAHPAVTSAITKQAARLLHTSNIYIIPQQEALAKALYDVSGMDNMFFGNSGAEANEAAIKIARLFGHQKGINTPTIIVMEGSFHGRTLATLTATGSRKVQAGFEPLVSGFVRVPFNDLEAVRGAARNNPKIAAVLVEPIQGEGGIRVPGENYLFELRAICDRWDWLLMLDEVQTGNGRTGKYFAYQHSGILPDVVSTAKGLGNGIPIGVCLARGKAANVLQPGNHGSTFGGNPLSCAAGLAVIKTIEEENLLERAADLSERIFYGLTKAFKEVSDIIEIRGRGLMIGIEMDRPCKELVAKAKAQGLLLDVIQERIIRLLPPLILGCGEADEIVDKVSKLVRLFISNR